MSLADPLPLSGLYDLLGIVDVDFVLNFQQELSSTGGGDDLYADLAPARWRATPVTKPMLHADAEGIMALINSRAGGLKTLLLTNPRLPYPSSDPDGSIFSTATPIVSAIADAYHVAFTGFPANYAIPRGTFFQVIFGSTRYYLGQFAEARMASAGGAVSSVEVAPALPASVATSNPVTVKKPAGKFRIVPNSAAPSTVDLNMTSIQFTAGQTYSA